MGRQRRRRKPLCVVQRARAGAWRRLSLGAGSRGRPDSERSTAIAAQCLRSAGEALLVAEVSVRRCLCHRERCEHRGCGCGTCEATASVLDYSHLAWAMRPSFAGWGWVLAGAREGCPTRSLVPHKQTPQFSPFESEPLGSGARQPPHVPELVMDHPLEL